MILIKKFKKLIPSYRHKKDVNIFDNQGGVCKTYHIKKKKTNLTHLRYKKKREYQFDTHVNIVISQHLNLIVQHYTYEYHPYRKLLVCKTLDNSLHLLPGIEYINVGSCIYSHFNKSMHNITNLLRGFISEVRKLPINTIISNLNNYNNSKNTFAKSAGTYCKLKKNKKNKKKLALLELPSGQEILLPQTTICFVGKNQNFQKTNLIEGSWGCSFSKFKVRRVRGVAMNPVDHPNGGRTKTVQPERSPWNWVAKKKK